MTEPWEAKKWLEAARPETMSFVRGRGATRGKAIPPERAAGVLSPWNESTASTAGRGWAATRLSWRRGRAAFRRGQRGLYFLRDQRGAVSFSRQRRDKGGGAGDSADRMKQEAELGPTIGSRPEPKQTTWPDRSTGGGTARLAKRRGRREGNGCRSGTDERVRACARERWPSAVGCVSSLCLSLPAR